MQLVRLLGQKPATRRVEICLEFIDRFRRTNPDNRYIFGLNVYTKALVQIFSIKAIIEDTKSVEEYCGIPIISFVEFESSVALSKAQGTKPIVLSAVGGKPLTAIKKLRDSGIDCLDYFNFSFFSDFPLPEIPMNESFKLEFETNINKFQKIYDRLDEVDSKAIFLKILKFRLSHDLDELAGFVDSQESQYFEPFLNISKNPGFVDVGCFDGFTTLKFIEKYPKFSQIIALEPERDNYLKCKALLDKHKDRNIIHLENVGVGSVPGPYSVSGKGSIAALRELEKNILEVSDNLVIVKTLDEIDLPEYDEFNTKIDWLLKMDIEGMELDAIAGAAGTIRTLHPTLAISVYHRPNHLWEISEMIFSISENYKVYVRHYTESIYETVMFFIPIPIESKSL